MAAHEKKLHTGYRSQASIPFTHFVAVNFAPRISRRAAFSNNIAYPKISDLGGSEAANEVLQLEIEFFGDLKTFYHYELNDSIGQRYIGSNCINTGSITDLSKMLLSRHRQIDGETET